ncbi:hypothetical protein [Desulfopila aestuarii]|uniref:Uncharacterized protein n=1 Tax=Desulfopila aestuarii DSM 18488 TaxID=1121416 RepID=A0A1M7Y7D3_9BACT|nr:hypothetical protein [Desulfopila aestuarii]SHO48543.1 hypothetical protein SAMN02745220_02358 [Desulfopila aestuarii DSM 18488]
MSQRKFRRAQQKSGKPQSQPQPSPSTTHQPSVQALVWYKEEHWLTLKEMFVDGDMLPASFDDWLTRAEKMKKDAEAAGDAVIKVFIDPETFPGWCESKGLPMDSEARSQLAIEVAQAQSFSV